MSERTTPADPKPPSVDRLSQFWHRINDHKMVQWSVAYIALAYGVQHGVELTSDAFEWPHAVVRVSMLLLVLGLPLVMTLAWYQGERASRQFTKAELSILSALLVIGSLFFYVFVQPSAEVAAGAAPGVQQDGVAAARTASLSRTGAISVAVLPFANMSGDAAQEYFSDGMSEEITSALAKIPDLRVVARESAFQFKGQKKDMRTVGQALGATHLIEGSVRKVGDRVRITAQLVQADSGLNVWTDSYDREMTDVFAIQEDIARAIAGSLRMPLGLKPGENLVNNRNIDPDSYQQTLRAHALIVARGLQPLTEATLLLEQIVARHPDYVPAWVELALAYDLIPNARPERNGPAPEFRHVTDAYLTRAEAAIRRTLQLDPNSAAGYMQLAGLSYQRGKPVESEEFYLKAIAMDPASISGANMHGRALHLAAEGRLKEALATWEEARTLEPLVPLYIQATVGGLWLNGRNDDAIALAKSLPPANRARSLAMIYASMGRYSEAADALKGLVPSGDARQEAVSEAARLLRTAPAKTDMPQKLPALGTVYAWVYLYVGAESRVLDNYETLLEGGRLPGQEMGWLWHPTYAPVRKTERFKTFVRKAGFIDYWRAKGWPKFCHPTIGDDFVCN